MSENTPIPTFHTLCDFGEVFWELAKMDNHYQRWYHIVWQDKTHNKCMEPIERKIFICMQLKGLYLPNMGNDHSEILKIKDDVH